MTGLHLLHPLQFPSSELHDDHVQRGALAQGLHTVLCVFTCQPRWLCRHSESYLKMSILCSGGKFEVSLLRRQNGLRAEAERIRNGGRTCLLSLMQSSPLASIRLSSSMFPCLRVWIKMAHGGVWIWMWEHHAPHPYPRPSISTK